MPAAGDEIVLFDTLDERLLQRLSASSTALAHGLVDASGDTPLGRLVGLMAERSVELIVGLIGISRDITERRAAEQATRASDCGRR